MLHDTPNIGSKILFDAATEIVKIIKKSLENFVAVDNQKIVISISGESGSGKSTIAYQLARILMTDCRGVKQDLNVKHLYVDNFYIENYKMNKPSQREARIISKGYEDIGPDEYDWGMIKNVLHCFDNGYVCRMPCVDILNQQIDYLETNFSDINILILDGLYAIDERLRSDFRFFVDSKYYQIKSWENVRQRYINRLDTIEGLYEYAMSVISMSNSDSQQDIRGKEQLTEARVIRLEKEHEAVQEMVSVIKNKNYVLSILKYVDNNWLVE